MDSLKQSSAKDDSSASPSTAGSLADSAATSHWDFINSRIIAPELNDRAPAFGVVTPDSPSASVRRSTTRRKHQEMFKAWSQERHD